MRDLVIGHRKNPARAAIQRFQSQFVLHRQPPLLPEEAVQMNRPVHRRHSVLGEQNNLHFPVMEKRNQVAGDGVNPRQIAERVRSDRLRPVPLQIVVQVRQVDEAEGGRVFLLDPFGRPGNPPRGRVRAALRVETPAAGPQNAGKGNSPRSLLIRSRMS